MTFINCRREENDPRRAPPGSDAPDANEPIETPSGAEPGPGPEPDHWSPGRETEPVLGS